MTGINRLANDRKSNCHKAPSRLITFWDLLRGEEVIR